MKNLLTLLFCFFCVDACLAQQAVERKNTLIDDIVEQYQATVDSNGVETKGWQIYCASRQKNYCQRPI